MGKMLTVTEWGNACVYLDIIQIILNESAIMHWNCLFILWYVGPWASHNRNGILMLSGSSGIIAYLPWSNAELLSNFDVYCECITHIMDVLMLLTHWGLKIFWHLMKIKEKILIQFSTILFLSIFIKVSQRHPIAHPHRWAMGCLLWDQCEIYVLCLCSLLQWYINIPYSLWGIDIYNRADSRLVPSQWEMPLLCISQCLDGAKPLSEPMLEYC